MGNFESCIHHKLRKSYKTLIIYVCSNRVPTSMLSVSILLYFLSMYQELPSSSIHVDKSYGDNVLSCDKRHRCMFSKSIIKVLVVIIKLLNFAFLSSSNKPLSYVYQKFSMEIGPSWVSGSVPTYVCFLKSESKGTKFLRGGSWFWT